MRPELFIFLLSLVAIGFGLFLTPERLASVGIMDRSLNSELELVRHTALLEINIAKWSLVLLGSLTALGAYFWPAFEARGAVERFMNRDFQYPPAYEAMLKRAVDGELLLVILLILASFAYISYAHVALSDATLRLINREDGVIEYATAILLLLASFVALYVSVRGRGRPAVRTFHLFFALLFFAMFGEEISWGQRIFGYATPETMERINAQKEFNLHNMFGYVFDHLFILCFFIWGCVLPLFYAISPVARQALRMIGLPLPSRGLAVGMLLITLYQEQLVHQLLDRQLPLLRVHLVTELRELFSAVAFLMMMGQSAAYLVPAREAAPQETYVKT